MIFSQFEEAVWHRRGSDCDIAEARHHSGEIVSAVEAVLEFGEVAGYMLVADGAVSASDGALDVAEGGVDPLEGRVQGSLATGSSDDRLVHAAGVADPSEAVQAVTDNGAGGLEIALRQGRDFGTAETLYAAQLQSFSLLAILHLEVEAVIDFFEIARAIFYDRFYSASVARAEQQQRP